MAGPARATDAMVWCASSRQLRGIRSRGRRDARDQNGSSVCEASWGASNRGAVCPDYDLITGNFTSQLTLGGETLTGSAGEFYMPNGFVARLDGSGAAQSAIGFGSSVVSSCCDGPSVATWPNGDWVVGGGASSLRPDGVVDFRVPRCIRRRGHARSCAAPRGGAQGLGGGAWLRCARPRGRAAHERRAARIGARLRRRRHPRADLRRGRAWKRPRSATTAMTVGRRC